MTDYFGVFLTGMSTGAGVIVSSKIINYLEHNPIAIKFKKTVDDITNLNDNGVKR